MASAEGQNSSRSCALAACLALRSSVHTGRGCRGSVGDPFRVVHTVEDAAEDVGAGRARTPSSPKPYSRVWISRA
jgi:hypothetical protein